METRPVGLESRGQAWELRLQGRAGHRVEAVTHHQERAWMWCRWMRRRTNIHKKTLSLEVPQPYLHVNRSRRKS